VEEAIKVLVSGGIVTPSAIAVTTHTLTREVANASGELVG
jgi:uncharacterized membrane protein